MIHGEAGGLYRGHTRPALDSGAERDGGTKGSAPFLSTRQNSSRKIRLAGPSIHTPFTQGVRRKTKTG